MLLISHETTPCYMKARFNVFGQRFYLGITPWKEATGACFSKFPKAFRARKLQSTCLAKLIFKHVFNVRKTKRIAKSDGLEPRCSKAYMSGLPSTLS